MSNASYDQFYGTVAGTPGGGKTFSHAQRRRLNIVAVCEMVFIPWLLFVAVFALMTFQIHHQHPHLTFMMCMLCLVGVVLIGGQAYRVYKQKKMGLPVEPTWLFFLFGASLFAWCLAMVLGEMNFQTNGGVFYDLQNMNSHGNVDPSTTSGARLMDAGKVYFLPGTKLNLTRSMGFRNVEQYCVAPIVFGDKPPITYDFWAVGLNCCSGLAPDFHCGEYNNPMATSGLRLMDDDQRPFFRLAVQQAEANYDIKADHPLFFHWMADPASHSTKLKEAAQRMYLLGMFAHFAFNLFCVTVATIAFTKIGFN